MVPTTRLLAFLYGLIWVLNSAAVVYCRPVEERAGGCCDVTSKTSTCLTHEDDQPCIIADQQDIVLGVPEDRPVQAGDIPTATWSAADATTAPGEEVVKQRKARQYDYLTAYPYSYSLPSEYPYSYSIPTEYSYSIPTISVPTFSVPSISVPTYNPYVPEYSMPGYSYPTNVAPTTGYTNTGGRKMNLKTIIGSVVGSITGFFSFLGGIWAWIKRRAKRKPKPHADAFNTADEQHKPLILANYPGANLPSLAYQPGPQPPGPYVPTSY